MDIEIMGDLCGSATWGTSMKRRHYLSTLTSGTIVAAGGCFSNDGNSKAQLGIITVSNYYLQSQRFVIHVEENDEDAFTTEIELDSGGNDPTSTVLDCGWSTDPGEFTIEIFQLTEPTGSVEVSIPGERTKDQDVGGCVGVDFLAGFREFETISPRVADCEEYTGDVEFCVEMEQ